MEELKNKIINVLVRHVWIVLWIIVLGGIAIILGAVLFEPLFVVFMVPYGVFSTYALHVLFDKWLDLPRKNKSEAKENGV